jgi:predicted Zn-dependent peptidase
VKPSRLAVLAALLAASPALAAFDDVETIDLPDGPRVVFARRPGRRATLVIRFDAGSVDDGGQSGLTRLGQHALLSANGSLDFVKFGLSVLSSAGTLQVETGLRTCRFVLTADRRDFGALAPRLAAALLSPRLDRARFPDASKRALHDGEEPGSGSGLLELIVSTAVKDPRYKNPPFGDAEQIELMAPEAVEGLFRGRLSAANATIVVAGSFDRDALLLQLRKLRGGRRIPLEPAPLELPVSAAWRYPTELHVVAWPVRMNTPGDAAAARLLAELVDRTLWEKFREAGAAYGYQVEIARSPFLDLLVAALPLRNPSGVNLAEVMLTAVRQVRDGRFDEARFERARAFALGKLEREEEDSERVARGLADGATFWFGAKAAGALRSLDRRSFLEIAAPWLSDAATIGLHFSPQGGR